MAVGIEGCAEVAFRSKADGLLGAARGYLGEISAFGLDAGREVNLSGTVKGLFENLIAHQVENPDLDGRIRALVEREDAGIDADESRGRAAREDADGRWFDIFILVDGELAFRIGFGGFVFFDKRNIGIADRDARFVSNGTANGISRGCCAKGGYNGRH